MRGRTFKQEYPSLFLALQDDAKKYPGGISALCERIGGSYSTLANGLNPFHESNPPSLEKIIKIIGLAQAEQAVFEICRLVGKVPMDIDLASDGIDDESQIKKFLLTVSKASDFISKGSQHASDGRFDAQEKRELQSMLKKIIQNAVNLHRALDQ